MKTPILISHLALLGGMVLGSCATTEESASADRMTAHVGRYSAPPAGIVRPKVGVPPFSVTGKNAKAEMNEVAADQATTLLVNSGRLVVIERAQLDKLLDEQNLAGIVRPGELVSQGQVEGVDYLLVGKVSNFRTKMTRKKRGFGLAKVGLGNVGLGAGDFKKEDVEIQTDCGVDLRLVDPASGRILVSDFSEYKRSDKASAIGVEVLGFDATAEAEMEIADDDYGKILRLALDDAIRKMLPKLDNQLLAMAPDQPATTNASSPPGEGAAGFCTGCGAQLTSTAAFCGGCGKKVGD